LDNIVFRMGAAPSRRAARQFVRHGHVRVNGVKVNIPSYKTKAGDVIEVRDAKQSRAYAQPHLEAAETLVPAWLSLDKGAFKAEVLHVPTREELSPAVNEQLIVELYSK
jgi:small subunit ribosomal protein S4